MMEKCEENTLGNIKKYMFQQIIQKGIKGQQKKSGIFYYFRKIKVGGEA